MTHSICIIDNGIPALQESLIDIETDKQLDTNTLKFLLRGEIDWTDNEENLKNLIDKLISDKENWDVSAFIDPKFFMDYINNNLTRPEIIIYDWEFPTSTTGHPVDNEEILYRILNENFAVVFIFSGAERNDEILTLIKSKRFQDFNNRIFLIDKNALSASGELPDESLIKTVTELMDKNFSFKFGAKIRQKSIEAVDRILVNLGKATLNDIYNYFKLTGDSKYDLVDFISERFKNRLSAMDMEDLAGEETEIGGGNDEEKLIKELWSYRLYCESSEDVVKKGDIIYEVEKGKDRIFLVISDDCDLARFWHKNYGHASLLPLTKFGKDQVELCNKMSMTRNLNARFKEGLKHPSLISRIDCLGEGQFFLPFIKIENEYITYIGFAKELENKRVEKPVASTDLKNEKLKYRDWNGIKPICRLTEPFLSPLIGYITRSLSGFGTPDYAPKVIDIIHKDLKKALE